MFCSCAHYNSHTMHPSFPRSFSNGFSLWAWAWAFGFAALSLSLWGSLSLVAGGLSTHGPKSCEFFSYRVLLSRRTCDHSGPMGPLKAKAHMCLGGGWHWPRPVRGRVDLLRYKQPTSLLFFAHLNRPPRRQQPRTLLASARLTPRSAAVRAACARSAKRLARAEEPPRWRPSARAERGGSRP